MDPLYMHASILKALQWRYAVKVFDPSKKVDPQDLRTILESGRLSPSSIGLEPWAFFLVENPEVRAKLREASYGQPKVTDASHLIVIATRTDASALPDELIARAAAQEGVTPESLAGWRAMAENAVARPDAVEWSRRQAYIPLGIMMTAASLLNVDTCPMEGFDTHKVDEILGLKEQHLGSVFMLTVGYRGDDPAAKRRKVRRPFEEVVRIVA